MKKYVIKRDKSGLPERLTRYREELNKQQFKVVTAKLFNYFEKSRNMYLYGKQNHLFVYFSGNLIVPS